MPQGRNSCSYLPPPSITGHSRTFPLSLPEAVWWPSLSPRVGRRHLPKSASAGTSVKYRRCCLEPDGPEMESAFWGEEQGRLLPPPQPWHPGASEEGGWVEGLRGEQMSPPRLGAGAAACPLGKVFSPADEIL
jgi:hypothetical protein